MKLRNYSIIAQGILICLSLLFLTAAKPEKVVVSEATPNSAEQGTSVPILIKGSGFAPGASVAFWRTGTTNPGGVTVLSVTYHDSQNITANIDVSSAADIDNYDIEVQLSSRRKGKGTELFSVKLKGGGPAPDACTLSTTFPTFAYWHDGSSDEDPLVLSDAEGACTATLNPDGNLGHQSFGLKMHYDSDSRTGRAVWTDHEAILLIEFVVALDNSVTIPIPVQEIAVLATNNAEGSFAEIDIDHVGGDLLTFSRHLPDGEAVYVVNIADCLAGGAWTPSGSSACSGTNSEVFSVGVDPQVGQAPYFTGINWSAASQTIYLVQFLDAFGAGTYAIDPLAPGNWSDTYLFDLNYEVSYTMIGGREYVATSEATSTACRAIAVYDVANCAASGGNCENLVSNVVYGAEPSWTADKRLVFKERSRRGKNQCRNPNTIAIFDPLDSGSEPRSLLTGLGPQGWQ